MGLNKKSVDDINVKGQRVLVRCDFNVPLQDGKITDENRLVAALPTIKKLVADGGKIILCSHLGKPKGEPKPELSLAPVAKRLTELLGQEVKFVPSPVVVDDTVKAAVADMKDGEIILLENTRYRAEETKNGDEFSKELASLCDVFVNDAFGTAHRAHCSNVGVTKYVDTAVVGYLMQKEIEAQRDEQQTAIREEGRVEVGEAGDLAFLFDEAAADDLMNVLEHADCRSCGNQEILKIVLDEADAYFKGRKTAQEAAQVMDRRAALFIAEAG